MSSLLLALFGGGRTGIYTVNVGSSAQGGTTFYGFGSSPTSYGSISPNIFSESGTSIINLGSTNIGFTGAVFISFTISGSSPQALFDNMVVGGRTFTSSSATFSSGSSTTWYWVITGTTDPFATNVGNNLVVTFN